MLPREQVLMDKICLDTNRLGWETARRFHTAWLERAGVEAWIPPTVAYELSQRQAISPAAEKASQAWDRKVDQERPSQRDEWWKAELEDAQGTYRELALDAEQLALKARVLEAWEGQDFVTGRTGRAQEEPDAHVLAEVLVGGGSVMMTCNLKSIKHHKANAWLDRYREEYGFTQAKMVVDADEQVAAVSCNTRGEELLVAAYIIAAGEPGRGAKDIDEYCGWLGKADLPRTASLLRDAVRSRAGDGRLAKLEGELLGRRWKTRERTARHPQFVGWAIGESGNTSEGVWTTRYSYAADYLEAALQAWREGGREERGIHACIAGVQEGATEEHKRGHALAERMVSDGPATVFALAREEGMVGPPDEATADRADKVFAGRVRQALREVHPDWRWNESEEGKAAVEAMRRRRAEEGVPSWVGREMRAPEVDAQGRITVYVEGGKTVGMDAAELATGRAMGPQIPDEELPQYMRSVKREAQEVQMLTRNRERTITRGQ